MNAIFDGEKKSSIRGNNGSLENARGTLENFDLDGSISFLRLLSFISFYVSLFAFPARFYRNIENSITSILSFNIDEKSSKNRVIPNRMSIGQSFTRSIRIFRDNIDIIVVKRMICGRR